MVLDVGSAGGARVVRCLRKPQCDWWDRIPPELTPITLSARKPNKLSLKTTNEAAATSSSSVYELPSMQAAQCTDAAEIATSPACQAYAAAGHGSPGPSASKEAATAAADANADAGGGGAGADASFGKFFDKRYDISRKKYTAKEKDAASVQEADEEEWQSPQKLSSPIDSSLCEIDYLPEPPSREFFNAKYRHKRPLVYRDFGWNGKFREDSQRGEITRRYGGRAITLSTVRASEARSGFIAVALAVFLTLLLCVYRLALLICAHRQANTYSYEKRRASLRDYISREMLADHSQTNRSALRTLYHFGDGAVSGYSCSSSAALCASIRALFMRWLCSYTDSSVRIIFEQTSSMDAEPNWQEQMLRSYRKPRFVLTESDLEATDNELGTLAFGMGGHGSGVSMHFHGPAFNEVR